MSTKQPQTVPGDGRIPPGIDEGLGIIDDLGQDSDCCRKCAGRVAAAPNKPNFPRSWAKNAGTAGKQSQSGRPRQPQLGIGDWGLGIRSEGRSGDVDETPNKPNLPFVATSRVVLVGPAGGDPGFRGGRCEIRVRRVDRMRNKANFRRFWPKNDDPRKKQSQCQNGEFWRVSLVAMASPKTGAEGPRLDAGEGTD
jgi:hypothetical protein